jgi:tetratricopeptide (TPR) repeat protein
VTGFATPPTSPAGRIASQPRLLASLLLALSAFAAFASAGTEISRVLDQAEYLLLNCHLDPGYLDSAAGLISSVRSADADNQRSLSLAARLGIQQADFEPDRAKRRPLYRAAQACADSLIGLDDRDARGYIWSGIALGRLGELNGVLNSLAMLPAVKRKFLRALELDPACPEPYEALGRLYSDVPEILGGDMDQAVTFFKNGLVLAPNYTILRLDLARACLKLSRKAEAIAQLDTLLATEEPYPPCDFVRHDRPEAERLRARLKAQK